MVTVYMDFYLCLSKNHSSITKKMKKNFNTMITITYFYELNYIQYKLYCIVLISYAKYMQHGNKFHFDPLNE